MFNTGQFVGDRLTLVLLNVLVPEAEVPEVVIGLVPANVRFVAVEVSKTVLFVPVKVMPLVKARLTDFVPDPANVNEAHENGLDISKVPEFSVQVPVVVTPGD